MKDRIDENIEDEDAEGNEVEVTRGNANIMEREDEDVVIHDTGEKLRWKIESMMVLKMKKIKVIKYK